MKKLFVTFGITTVATFSSLSALAEGMKPGLWEFTTQMSGAGMPAMPAIPEAQRKQMEAMGIKMPQMAGGGMGITTKVCISAEQAKKGVPPNSDKDGEKCEQTDVKTSGKTTSWKMICTGKRKLTGFDRIRLTVSRSARLHNCGGRPRSINAMSCSTMSPIRKKATSSAPARWADRRNPFIPRTG